MHSTAESREGSGCSARRQGSEREIYPCTGRGFGIRPERLHPDGERLTATRRSRDLRKPPDGTAPKAGIGVIYRTSPSTINRGLGRQRDHRLLDASVILENDYRSVDRL